MSLLNVGGVRWDPNLVAWGRVGRPRSGGGPTREMLGYWATNEGRGALSRETKRRRTVDVWNCTAVYALFERGAVVYVGEGVLGNRLATHWKRDDLVGAWSSFTWLSTAEYKLSSTGVASLSEKKTPERVTPKELVELLELIAVRLGSPTTNNRQLPTLNRQIRWITQVRSEASAPSIESKIDEILVRLSGSGQQRPL